MDCRKVFLFVGEIYSDFVTNVVKVDNSTLDEFSGRYVVSCRRCELILLLCCSLYYSNGRDRDCRVGRRVRSAKSQESEG